MVVFKPDGRIIKLRNEEEILQYKKDMAWKRKKEKEIFEEGVSFFLGGVGVMIPYAVMLAVFLYFKC